MAISAVIITLNEEKKIAECLKALKFADEIVIVDSGSIDNTVKIARQFGAKVFYRGFDNFSSQKNFAIEKASNEWIFFVDADEVISKELAAEANQAVCRYDFDAYSILRTNIIFGKEMKYGGHQNDVHVRLFNKNRARFRGLVHEKIVVEGKIGSLDFPMVHYSTANINEYKKKFGLYMDLEVEYLIERKVEVGKLDKIWKPIAGFLKQYFFQKGFLDGGRGLEFYLLSALYVYVKYDKYEKRIKQDKIRRGMI